MPQDYYRPEQVLDHLHDELEEYKGDLGLRYVAYGDERLLPEYPAMTLMAAPVGRDLHTTGGYYLVTFLMEMFIYHADLTVNRKQRTKEDLELVTNVVNFLHQRPTLGGHIIFGFVTAESPGLIQRGKGSAVIGSRLTWEGSNREPQMLSGGG